MYASNQLKPGFCNRGGGLEKPDSLVSNQLFTNMHMQDKRVQKETVTVTHVVKKEERSLH